jgi:hypothetical protein
VFIIFLNVHNAVIKGGVLMGDKNPKKPEKKKKKVEKNFIDTTVQVEDVKKSK